MSLPQLSEVLTLRPPPQQRLSIAAVTREPEQATACFVLTKEAEGSLARVLSALRRGRPGVFWINGEHGAGKTHFLAYLNAILERPDSAPEDFRDDVPDTEILTVALEVRDGAQIAQAVSALLWQRLKVPRHLSDLWRRLGAEVGLRATLEEVGRGGFKRALILIDDAGDKGLDSERWRMLADMAASTRSFKAQAFFLVASQGEPPESVPQLPVGPKGAREIAALTLAHLRDFGPNSEPALKSYFDLYAAANPTLLDFSEFRGIFPLHERTIEVLDALSRDSRRAGVISDIIGEAMAVNGAAPQILASRRLIMPTDLLRSPAARLRIRASALSQSFEGYELALMRLDELGFTAADQALADDVIKTLFLTSFISDQRRKALKAEELVQLAGFDRPAANADKISRLLASMASALDGLIVVDNEGRARYQPSERPGSFLRRWNESLPLLRLVAPELTEVESASALFAQAEAFRAALGSRGAHFRELASEVQRLAAALAAAEPKLGALPSFESLLSAGNHEAYLRRAAQIAGGAEALHALGEEVARLQKIAARAPQLIQIKHYLDQMPVGAAALESIEPRRRTLAADLDFNSIFARPELADSVVDQFAQLKTLYREIYAEAHRKRRIELQSFTDKFATQQLSYALLMRLNNIRELGPAAGAELEEGLKRLTMQFSACSDAQQPSLDSEPRCSTCGFAFEDGPPMPEIEALESRLSALLIAKFRHLARPTMVRLLDDYDSDHRLAAALQLLRQGANHELLRALDPDLLGYLSTVLAKARSEATTFNLVQIFPDWPPVSEEDLDELLESFAATLKDAFSRMRQAHPGRRARLALN